MLNEDCENRLENWKFLSAQRYCTPETAKYEREVINALAEMVGNCGWLPRGTLGVLIGVAVDALIDGRLADQETDDAR